MRATDFVSSYMDAWNHRDAEGVAEHLAVNGTYYDIPTQSQFSKNELVSNLIDFFASGDHQYQLCNEVLSNEKSIAFQYKMTSPKSSQRDWLGAEFILLEDDGALSITDYYDPHQSVRSPSFGFERVAMPKYAKSGLDVHHIENYKKKLVTLMEEEKVFLDCDMTLPKLAAMVDCSINHLSQVVNSGLNMSFFDFLNSYRINEAKSILIRQDSLSQSILDVSFAVGFNSNSAFYAAFKKATGQTPAQFRRETKFMAN
jgi:AraC-like DNA-binding protein